MLKNLLKLQLSEMETVLATTKAAVVDAKILAANTTGAAPCATLKL